MARRSPTGSVDGTRKKKLYREGDWCAVPLTPTGFAVGIIARASRQGALFGYFFKPRRSIVPVLKELQVLRPEDAALVTIFGDGGLQARTWVVIGQAGKWERATWPLPLFVIRDSESQEPTMIVQCSEDDPIRISSTRQVAGTGDLSGLPTFGLAGHKYVEGVLSELTSRDELDR